MFEFFDQLDLQQLTTQAIVLRFLLACIFSGVLGFERTRKRRAAGFRTYMLVCIGATSAMMTGQFMMMHFEGTDPARLGAQVISGIGFLGAGTIIVTGAKQIKGLTTAAGLWTSACMGVALGIGFYVGALVMCLAMIMVMTIFDAVQTRYISRSKEISLYIIFEKFNYFTEFFDFCKAKNIIIKNFETMPSPGSTWVAILFFLCFQEKKSHTEVIEMINKYDGLISIEEF